MASNEYREDGTPASGIPMVGAFVGLFYGYDIAEWVGAIIGLFIGAYLGQLAERLLWKTLLVLAAIIRVLMWQTVREAIFN